MYLCHLRRVRVYTQLAAGKRVANVMGMKHTLVLLAIMMTASCARKVDVRAPQFTLAERYAYIKDNNGRVYIVTSNTKDFDEAMKKIHPGPATVDKLDLWVITPLGPVRKGAR
jgi:hypothetical protein